MCHSPRYVCQAHSGSLVGGGHRVISHGSDGMVALPGVGAVAVERKG